MNGSILRRCECHYLEAGSEKNDEISELLAFPSERIVLTVSTGASNKSLLLNTVSEAEFRVSYARKQSLLNERTKETRVTDV